MTTQTPTSTTEAEAAKQWLLDSATKLKPHTNFEQIRNGCYVHSISLSNLSISYCSAGRVLCSFRVPPHLSDEDGNWHAGAIATLMDDVGAAAIMTIVGHIKISVDFSISYFSPAKVNEEMEIYARMVEHKGVGKLTSVKIEVKKKGSGELVALGRQWMATSPLVAQHTSKL